MVRLSAFALALLVPLAHAQAPDTGRTLAATCANCHGTDGHAVAGMPALAGRPHAELAQALRDFREGRRPATVMTQLAKGYNDAQIEAIAAYLAARPQRREAP